MKKAISLEKVAERAGVAKSTVSFVLNDKGKVAPQTKARVLSALQELGYAKEAVTIPIQVLSRPNQDKKNVLIYVNPSVQESEVALTYMAGLRQYATETGKLAFSFAISSSEVESSVQLDFLVQATQPQAIAMIGINTDHPFVTLALQTGKPCLIINRVSQLPTLSYISINHEEAGKAAARYLLKLGHCHFALVLEDYYNETERTRLEGFLAALSPEHKVALIKRYKPPTKVVNFGQLCQLMQSGAVQFNADTPLKTPPKLPLMRDITQLDSTFNPTVIVAADDRTAAVTQAGLQAAGLIIPRNVSIMSLNNSSIALSANPPITAIDEQWHTQGYLAGLTLENLINYKDIGCQKTQIQHRLLERASTAAYSAEG